MSAQEPQIYQTEKDLINIELGSQLLRLELQLEELQKKYDQKCAEAQRMHAAFHTMKEKRDFHLKQRETEQKRIKAMLRGESRKKNALARELDLLGSYFADAQADIAGAYAVVDACHQALIKHGVLPEEMPVELVQLKWPKGLKEQVEHARSADTDGPASCGGAETGGNNADPAAAGACADGNEQAGSVPGSDA